MFANGNKGKKHPLTPEKENAKDRNGCLEQIIPE